MSLRFSVSQKHRKSQKIYLTERLVRAFITSRPDVYCNRSLYGLPAKGISKSLRLQNFAARLVMKCKLRDHIAPSLQKLSVLSHRMTFKIIKVRHTMRILQCWSYYVKINFARHQHDTKRIQNRAGSVAAVYVQYIRLRSFAVNIHLRSH